MTKNFWDDFDDMDNGGGGFEPLPVDTYQWALVGHQFKVSRGGDLMTRMEFEVTNDTVEAYNGRKTWCNFMLEGVTDEGHTKCWMLVKLVKAIRWFYAANADQYVFDMDTLIPPHTSRTEAGMIFERVPRDEDGNPVTTQWATWLDNLVGANFLCGVKHVPRRVKDANGNWTDSADELDHELDSNTFRVK